VILGSFHQVRVFVYREPVDMRKAYDTLSALVEGPMKKAQRRSPAAMTRCVIVSQAAC